MTDDTCKDIRRADENQLIHDIQNAYCTFNEMLVNIDQLERAEIRLNQLHKYFFQGAQLGGCRKGALLIFKDNMLKILNSYNINNT